MTPKVISRLEEVFALGGSDREACFYADISTQTLYDYQQAHPEFVDRKESLKEQPILQARRTVVNAIMKHPGDAQWYLERKAKKEFAARQEHTAADGAPLFDHDHKEKGKSAVGRFLGGHPK